VDRHGSLPHSLPERILPPPVCSPVLSRAKLSRWLADLPRRRLSVLIAGAGYGKSTLLAHWATEHPCAWYTTDHADEDPLTLARGLVAALRVRVADLPDELVDTLTGVRGSAGAVTAFVPALATALHERLRQDLVLVIDDVHHVFAGPESVRCLAELVHVAPQRLHLVLASRTELPFPITRLQMAGHAAVVTAERLRFDRAETAELLDLVAGPVPPEHVDRLVALTGGWPAAVRLAAEALTTAEDRTAVVDGWSTPGGLADLLDNLLSIEVIPRLTPAQRELLRVGGALATFDVDLLDHLGVPDASEAVAAARTRGILIMPTAADPHRFTLTEVARRYVQRRLTATDTERIRRAAATWFRERGEFDEALRYLILLGASADIADLLSRVGSALLSSGHAELVLAACAAVRPEDRGPALDLVEGEAYQLRGDWDRAIDRLSRLVPDDGSAPVAVAWRLGLIHHLRGDLTTALELYRRGLSDPTPGQERDRAMAAGWGAAAAWLSGEIEECRRLTALAVKLAEACGDAKASAAAHTATAMLAALDGDRRANDRHYVHALRYAEQAGDVLQVIRIRSNQGSRLLEEGEYAAACAELDVAIRLAELADFPVLRALALVNRAEAQRLLGHLEEATRDAQAALTELQRLGSRLAAYPLVVLGDIHLTEGDAVQAQARYEEAVSLTEAAGDLQGLQPALAGLAVALLDEDMEAAARYAERAVAVGPSLGQTRALLAEARVALARGNRSRAAKASSEATDVARSRRDRPGLAEALELRAAVTEDPAQARAALEEAQSLWQALEAPVGLARTRVALARLSSDAAAQRLLTMVVDECRRIGARRIAADAAALLAKQSDTSTAPLAIRTLGGLVVTRHGRPVPHSEWRSRKARDLLKMLVARRGTPLARECILEAMWPDEPPERATARLSVALSTLRAVLDPDKAFPPDHYVVSASGALWLRRQHIVIDVEEFLAEAAAALAAHRSRGDALEALARAEARYTGDFCDEDLDAPYLTALREEARATYVATLRALAEEYARRDDPDAATRCLLRLLAKDPYDEPAHLALVRTLDRAGRYGEARRLYRAYVARMAELDVEPAAYPCADRMT